MIVPSAPRPAEPNDAVLGVRPRLVLEPGTVDEAAEAMRALAADRLAVTFVGGGTDLELGAPPARLDALLRTTRLARVREHAPSDQIVAVEAGMTVAALQRMLAPHGQRLALDPPDPERATLGGVLAANAFGPRRTRYGAVRDLVIGITVVRADGVLAHGGGKVVKNVAGFDLPRLFCGSLGTLGLVAEVVFRLHPLPEASATAAFEGLSGVDVAETIPVLRELAVEPTAVAALSEGGPLPSPASRGDGGPGTSPLPSPASRGDGGPGVNKFTLAIRFEGFAPGVRDQAERTLARAGGGTRLDGAEEAALWARHDALRTGGSVRAKATFAPAALVKALDALAPLRRSLSGGGLVLHPALGIALLAGELADADAAGAAVASARAALHPLANGALVLSAAPRSLRARAEVWGAAPAAVEVMRRLKRELDPDGRLAPGRFVGGI